ncbi:MAG: epoxyqueuosine reductase [Desulfuromonadales bacterium]|nr:epoxyqueuosine reductase [Desulfuromonadales bacterium]
MEQLLRDEIRDYVLESPDNRFPGSDARYFDEPLIGFAAARDPLFSQFITVIGGYHLTPAEIMENCYGAVLGEAVTVICWVLPITRSTREGNRRQERTPSREWAFTRAHGEQFNTFLRMFVVDLLRQYGIQAVAPLLSGMWSPVREEPSGLSSTWSERHAAYVAGLGTFSLNDGLITEKGIAHRCGSVITDTPIPPTPRREGADHRGNCLYFSQGSCGLCIQRCPVGAISWQGHDKEKCREYVYGELRATVGQSYGIMETGCGLCQTRVPCEACIPPGTGQKKGEGQVSLC